MKNTVTFTYLNCVGTHDLDDLARLMETDSGNMRVRDLIGIFQKATGNMVPEDGSYGVYVNNVTAHRHTKVRPGDTVEMRRVNDITEDDQEDQ